MYGKTGSKLYGPKSGADFVDNHRRFALFNKAAIEATRALPFGFGEDCVFVANDWHSALIPVMIKDVYQPKGEFLKAKVALCIHNIAFQVRACDRAPLVPSPPPLALYRVSLKSVSLAGLHLLIRVKGMCMPFPPKPKPTLTCFPQGRMWEDTFSDMGLPIASLSKFSFTDGVAKLYTEDDPMEEDEVPPPVTGSFKKVGRCESPHT